MGKNTIISAISNLSTAYNLVVINIVHVLVQNQYCGGDKCKHEVSIASTACLVGAIVGQLTFGYVGDLLGRGLALQLTMALSILGSFASAFAVPLDASAPASIFYFLAITRFVLGIGVGGVYPLSATIAAESASSAASRGRTASIVFSMQGVANLLVPLVALILIAIFGNPRNLDDDGPGDIGLSWRLALGAGALPGVLLAPFKVAETRQGHAGAGHAASGDANGAAGFTCAPGSMQVHPTADAAAGGGSPAASLRCRPPSLTLWQALQIRAYWGKLVGCAGGWFLFDITFYGNSLFQAPVLKQIFHVNSTHEATPVAGDLHTNRALQMLIIAGIGLPGYYVAVVLMDHMGRRLIQLQGFFFMSVAFLVLGVGFGPLQQLPALMLLVYGLTFFFSNFGPNSTTFILPAETFPQHLRSTLNGFCAASGKVGATMGSATFVALKSAVGLGNTMVACAVVSLLGYLVTYLFVEDRRGKGMEGDEAPATGLLGSEHPSTAAVDDLVAVTEDARGNKPVAFDSI